MTAMLDSNTQSKVAMEQAQATQPSSYKQF
jgi:hypothetical protein